MIKKYTNGSWSEVKYKKCGNKTEEFAEFPVTIRGDGNDLMDYGISGNMSQASGVSPTTPIQPQECGEMTGNLFDENYPNIKVATPVYRSIYVGDGTFTLSTTTAQHASIANLFLLAGNVGGGASTQDNGVWNGNPRTVTAVDGYVTIGYRYYENDEISDPRSNDVMLNTGSQPLPYEPFGIKIPISSANTTTPIYLGEVETTRKIGKLVLTGNEIIFRDKEREGSWRFYTDKLISAKVYTGICSHFEKISTNDINNSDNIGFSIFNAAQFGCRCPKSIANTVADFKSYLAQQYAARTPVTVWYVLATPTTGTVNEPIRKIGDYADTLSMEQAGVQIPTNSGNTVIDVETELKPSEMTLNWRGWHVADVKEYSDGGWR